MHCILVFWGTGQVLRACWQLCTNWQNNVCCLFLPTCFEKLWSQECTGASPGAVFSATIKYFQLGFQPLIPTRQMIFMGNIMCAYNGVKNVLRVAYTKVKTHPFSAHSHICWNFLTARKVSPQGCEAWSVQRRWATLRRWRGANVWFCIVFWRCLALCSTQSPQVQRSDWGYWLDSILQCLSPRQMS